MQTQRIAVYVANSTRLSYLDVHLDGFHVRQRILFKICIHVNDNMRYWIRY